MAISIAEFVCFGLDGHFLWGVRASVVETREVGLGDTSAIIDLCEKEDVFGVKVLVVPSRDEEPV
jgi:hypothetical protein